MRNGRTAILLGSLLAVALAAPVFARSASAAATAASDRSFVIEAARGGMAEVELGKLAVEKASNPDVKHFGQHMVDDHGKANEELKTLARNKNISLPAEIDAKNKALHDRLSKMSGEAFDRAYMQAMVMDHRQDVNAFLRQSQMASDPEIKAFAAKTLPTLEDHLRMAQEANRAAVATTGHVK